MAKSLLTLALIVSCALSLSLHNQNVNQTITSPQSNNRINSTIAAGPAAAQPTYKTSHPDQCSTNAVKSKIPLVDGRAWVYSGPFKITCGKLN